MLTIPACGSRGRKSEIQSQPWLRRASELKLVYQSPWLKKTNNNNYNQTTLDFLSVAFQISKKSEPYI